VNSLLSAPWLTIVTGHYGVGKTNLSLNIARDVRARVGQVTLVDLDLVNPYFRTTDNRDFLDTHDIKVLGPVFGASSLDTPSLTPGIDEAIIEASASHAVVIDVGGDPEGARALGRFAASITSRPYQMIQVVNLSRPETLSVEENISLLRAIETTSGLRVTEIVGNTHLKELSTAEDIVAAIEPTCAIAAAAGLPLSFIAVPRRLAKEVVVALAESMLAEGAVVLAESMLAEGAVVLAENTPAQYSPADSALTQDTSTQRSNAAIIPVYPIDIIVGTPWEL